MFGRTVCDRNENSVFLVKRIDVLNNISESINTNLKDYVEFEVIKAVAGAGVTYFGINLLKFPKNLHRQTRIRRQQIALKRRQFSIRLNGITTKETVIFTNENCYRIQTDVLKMRQCTYNATLRSFRATNIVGEKQYLLHILSVFLHT